MKSALAFLLLACSAATAAPEWKPPVNPGLYVADSSISHAPPRTTWVLIEPNGETWIATDWRAMYVQFIGGLNDQGSSKRTTYPKMTPHDLDLTVHGKQDSIHLNFTVKKLPMEGYFHTIHPQGKRGTFDVGYRAAFVEDRQRGIETPVLVPGNYASIRSGPMHLSLGSDGESISGAEDGCPFSGRIYGGHYYHKEITYLIKADCYVGGQFIAKGTRMTGVIFSATNIGSIYWNYPITDQVGHVIIVRSTVGEPRAVSFFIR